MLCRNRRTDRHHLNDTMPCLSPEAQARRNKRVQQMADTLAAGRDPLTGRLLTPLERAEVEEKASTRRGPEWKAVRAV